MREVIKVEKVFTYDELSDRAKEKAKQSYLTDCADILCNDYYEWVMQDVGWLFPTSSLDIEFSLDYSHHDGFNIWGKVYAQDMFYCVDNKEGITILDKYKGIFTADEQAKIIAYGNDCGLIDVPKNFYHGDAYCCADNIELADEWIEALELCEYDKEDIDVELLKRFETYVQNVFNFLCKEYKELGYEELYEISDEHMSNLCEWNNWEFLADGMLYSD